MHLLPWALPGKRGALRGLWSPILASTEAWLLCGTASLSISGACSSIGHPGARRCGDLSSSQCTHSAPYSLLQVLPHVLHVCQPGVCGANAAADAQLAAPLPLLPLVSRVGWGRTGTPQDTPVWGPQGTLTAPCSLQDPVLPGHEPVSGADVHLLLVLRTGGHADRRPHLQIHRVPRVRETMVPQVLARPPWPHGLSMWLLSSPRLLVPGCSRVPVQCSLARAMGIPYVLLVPAGRRRSGVMGSEACP